MNDMVKNLLLWLVIAAVLLSVFNNFNMKNEAEQVGYSDFIREVQNAQVKRVVVDGLTISGERQDGSEFETIRPMLEDPKLIDDLLQHSVVVEGQKPEQQSVWTQLLVASFPILIIIAVFMFFMRQMQGGVGGRGGPMSFGKSKARLLGEDQITTTFADVAGVDEAKEDVKELVDFLRDLAHRAKTFGEQDLADLRQFAASELGMQDPQPWDWAYIGEKLKQARFAFSEQEVRQYFPLPKVLEGLFKIVETLFNVAIRPDKAPVWNPGVHFYRIEGSARAGEADRVSTSLIGQFDLDEPGRTVGVVVDQLRVRLQIVVDRDDLAADRRVDRLGRLDRLDRAVDFPFSYPFAHAGQLNEYHIGQGVLSVVADAAHHRISLHARPVVTLGVACCRVEFVSHKRISFD